LNEKHISIIKKKVKERPKIAEKRKKKSRSHHRFSSVGARNVENS